MRPKYIESPKSEVNFKKNLISAFFHSLSLTVLHLCYYVVFGHFQSLFEKKIPVSSLFCVIFLKKRCHLLGLTKCIWNSAFLICLEKMRLVHSKYRLFLGSAGSSITPILYFPFWIIICLHVCKWQLTNTSLIKEKEITSIFVKLTFLCVCVF